MPRHYDLCARVQNGFRARLRRIAVPDTKLNLAISNVLYKEGFIAGVSRGDHVQPDTTFVPTTPDNIATRRLWLELKYNNDEPVLKKMSAVSKPSKKIVMKVQELQDLAAGNRAQFIKGLQPGEIAILTTNYGVLELREALEKGAGGEVLQIQSNYHKASLSVNNNLRRRRPRTKDSLDKEKRIRLLDEAIVTGNIEALRRLSVTGAGFVNDAIRRRAWPLLLRTHVPRRDFEHETSSHKDDEQVRLDVIRSFTHLPTDTKSQQSFKKQKQEDLLHVISDVLQRHPKLSYYQGFHDVCTCLILVLGKEAAMPAAESLAMFFFRDCMLDNLEPVLDQLSLMTTLLRLEDPEVQEFLDKSETLPYFPLSWVITWCSHNLKDFGEIARIYDFLMCFNPLMSVYLAAAVVMSRKEELFEVECDNAMVHSFLTKFPKDANIELLISHAHKLYVTYPPGALQNQAKNWLDENSCVNTFNQSNTRLYYDDDEKAYSTPVDFGPIDSLLGKPRVKRTADSSALSKYPKNALLLYQRNFFTMVVFSAASVGTAAATLLILNPPLLKEWLNQAGLL
ncbi:hypothetical protein BGZ49_008466 [Haplosporangium sp. Z 27]|nr:hypothetical protein BGZ49_008466 [Haplosporangium sp. Z 27]